MLLLGSLFIGSHLLQLFGITIPVLRIAGGLAVASFGWSLLRDGIEPDRSAGRRNEDGVVDAFYPLTVGPGSIAVAIALGAQRPQGIESVERMTMLAGGAVDGIAAIAATVFLCYRFPDTKVKGLRANGINVLIRLSAFILRCIGIQIIWSGVSALVGTSGR